ncbi:MAG: LacI family DNA-binding transcriptional regulator [Bacilli bacterium]
MSDAYKDRVTIYEVAAAAGVSLATVSRVINNHPNVTPATRAKVQNAITRLGYRPSALAQALATSKTTNIGLIIPSANYVFISNMLHGIVMRANSLGYLITLFVTGTKKEDALDAMDKLISSHVDGAIIFDDLFEEEEVTQITNYQVPVVVVNNRLDEDEKVACITFGYENTLREDIIRHHLKTSDVMMHFVALNDNGRLLDRLQRSFVNTHKEENREYKIHKVQDGYHAHYAYFKELFKTTKEGFFVAYRDSLGRAIVNAALENGLRIPEDIEVISLIGTRYAVQGRPKLSSMILDMEEVGNKALEMLIEILEGKTHLPRQKVVAEYIKLDTTR